MFSMLSIPIALSLMLSNHVSTPCLYHSPNDDHSLWITHPYSFMLDPLELRPSPNVWCHSKNLVSQIWDAQICVLFIQLLNLNFSICRDITCYFIQCVDSLKECHFFFQSQNFHTLHCSVH